MIGKRVRCTCEYCISISRPFCIPDMFLSDLLRSIEGLDRLYRQGTIDYSTFVQHCINIHEDFCGEKIDE